MRGKAALIQAAIGGRSIDHARLADIVSACSDCRNCMQECPSAIDTRMISRLGPIILSMAARENSGKGISLAVRDLTEVAKAGGALKQLRAMLHQRREAGFAMIDDGFPLIICHDRHRGRVRASRVLSATGINGRVFGFSLCELKGLETEMGRRLYLSKVSSFLDQTGRQKAPQLLTTCVHCLETVSLLPWLFEFTERERELLDSIGDIYTALADSDWEPPFRLSGGFILHLPTGVSTFNAEGNPAKEILTGMVEDPYHGVRSVKGPCGGDLTDSSVHAELATAVTELLVKEIKRKRPNSVVVLDDRCLSQISAFQNEGEFEVHHLLDLIGGRF